MLFEVRLYRLFSMTSRMNYVTSSYVSMMCSLLMTAGPVMLSRFLVVASGMRQMF